MTPFGDLRTLVTVALTGLAPAGDDWPAHDGPPDSVTPPCYVLVWPPDQWATPLAVCSYVARLDVICVGARIDPTPGYEQLEALISAAVPALEAATVTVDGVNGPGPLEVGGLTYQAARIRLSHPVIFGGS